MRISGTRKKTAHPIAQVMPVMKGKPDGLLIHQQSLREPYVIDGVPDGFYCLKDGRIICPKKRGEKVFVRYTSVFMESI
jgi:hypothetical protein